MCKTLLFALLFLCCATTAFPSVIAEANCGYETTIDIGPDRASANCTGSAIVPGGAVLRTESEAEGYFSLDPLFFSASVKANSLAFIECTPPGCPSEGRLPTEAEVNIESAFRFDGPTLGPYTIIIQPALLEETDSLADSGATISVGQGSTVEYSLSGTNWLFLPVVSGDIIRVSMSARAFNEACYLGNCLGGTSYSSTEGYVTSASVLRGHVDAYDPSAVVNDYRLSSLSEVPEPGSAIMVAGAVLGIALIKYWRRVRPSEA